MRMIASGSIACAMALMTMPMIIMPMMRVMDGMLDMLRFFPTRLSKEGQEDKAPAIKAGQQGCEHTDEESITMPGAVDA